MSTCIDWRKIFVSLVCHSYKTNFGFLSWNINMIPNSIRNNDGYFQLWMSMRDASRTLSRDKLFVTCEGVSNAYPIFTSRFCKCRLKLLFRKVSWNFNIDILFATFIKNLRNEHNYPSKYTTPKNRICSKSKKQNFWLWQLKRKRMMIPTNLGMVMLIKVVRKIGY